MATEAAVRQALELVPLGTARVNLAPVLTLENTPLGTRLVVEITGYEIETDRLKAKLKGSAAADWVTVGPDGVATIDVRLTLETHDGALIYVHYHGRTNVSNGPPLTVYSTPLMDTGDPRYAWLNKIQVVAKGTTSADLSYLEYDLYEMR
jgi:hypothetical protein